MKKGLLLLVLVFVGFASTFATEARAGSYLDRASLLVDGTRGDMASLRAHLTDKELARMVHVVARARFDAGQKMDVPALVGKAHPHLLLCLAHAEKAADAAMSGNFKAAALELEGVKLEESLFRAALKETGYPLPAADDAARSAVRLAPVAASP